MKLPVESKLRHLISLVAMQGRWRTTGNLDIDHISIPIDGPPQILTASIDRDEQLIEMPDISEPTWSLLQSAAYAIQPS